MRVKLISAQGIMLDEQADAVVLRGMEGPAMCRSAKDHSAAASRWQADMPTCMMRCSPSWEKRRWKMEEKREFRHRARGSSDAFFSRCSGDRKGSMFERKFSTMRKGRPA